MKVDLHIHSYHSDGRYSPTKIVEYAIQKKLDIISLTDHDTTAGLQEARERARSFPSLKFISGVELSTNLGDDELHILGYGIDEQAPRMEALLNLAQDNRRKRVRRILDSLKSSGIDLSLEEVNNGGYAVSLGRMHVAQLLLKRGHVRNIREAFDRYLSYESNIIKYSPTDFVSTQYAIEIILEAGGIPVFAHPKIAVFDRYIDRLIEFGLQGVEVFKGSRPSIEEYYLETVVKDKGLFSTGGSDWHGHHPTLHLGKFYVDAERIRPFLRQVALR